MGSFVQDAFNIEFGFAVDDNRINPADPSLREAIRLRARLKLRDVEHWVHLT